MKLKWTLPLMIMVVFFSCKEVKPEAPIANDDKRLTTKTATAKSQFEDLEGKPIALADYKGKKVLLNYWATWCRPCLEEMPSLLKAQSILTKENYVFLLASDQSVATISAFKAKRGYDFNFIKFNGSLAAEQINALPVTFIYNEAGKKVETILGGVVWDSPEMIQKLKTLR